MDPGLRRGDGGRLTSLANLVIPAKAGIQIVLEAMRAVLDPGFPR